MDKHSGHEHEINDLKQELKNFQQEKERVREIIGRIGGMPKFHTKLINTVFILTIIVSVAIAVLSDDKWRLLMIEFATVALSIKIIYLIHCQMRINHFKFWILSSIEWRLNELIRQIQQAKKCDESDQDST